MKTYVVKFGGNAIRGKTDLIRLSEEAAELIRSNIGIVLVHGGGPEISDEMEKRGLVPAKAAGLRVTDRKTLEVAEEVLGSLNREITGSLTESGVNAIGLPGYLCTLCRKKGPYTVTDGGKDVTVDLGLVGEVTGVNSDMIYDLLGSGITPVIYPIGADREGNHLNVNADTMAAGIAAGINCEELVTITDVPGIMTDVRDPSSKLDSVSLETVDKMIKAGVISGGMIPKVEACRNALNSGVKAVRIVSGKDPRSIMTDAIKGIPHGTVITR
ncbi:MAG: acetylglutamate kinase [Candidatus Methanoplasma sp.]|jgi:acetylglutamate kinase|nr:acetylglutamate kinase [Candidatus Methanoplasma sp.]